MRNHRSAIFFSLPLLLASLAAGCGDAAEPGGARVAPPQPRASHGDDEVQLDVGGPSMHTENGGISNLDLRWPGALVQYYLESQGSTALTALQIQNFHTAVTLIEESTPVRFKEYLLDGFNALPNSADIIYVWNKFDANSGHCDVGRQHGTQSYMMGGAGGGGYSVAAILHELGHGMGLRHEMQRTDRSSILHACTANITDTDYDLRTDIDFLTPYDVHSIMHYKRDGFVSQTPDVTQCGGFTMALNVPGSNTYANADACTTCPAGAPSNATCVYSCDYIGMMSRFTLHDINGLNLMYGRSLGKPEVGDVFGTALAVADLDQDGYDDVIAGAPGEQPYTGPAAAGAVFAYKGTMRGLTPWKVLANSPRQGDDFGRAIATGDFNHDGFPDIAVGAPKRALANQPNSGTVTLYYGGRFAGALATPDCPVNVKCQLGGFPTIVARFELSPADALNVKAEAGDLFGSALTVADFDGDGFADLVVGAPGKALGNGRVFVYSGKALETSLTPAIMLGGSDKGSFGSFGSALGTGDFNGDKKVDLAVGAPGAGQGHASIYQAVTITSFVERAFVSAPATVQSGERFGTALTGVQLAGATRPTQLAVGAPLVRQGGGEVDVFSFNSVFTPNLVQQQSAGTYRGGYGSALLAFDANGDAFQDLAVGAPLFAQNEGVVEILRGSGGTAVHFDQILPTTSGGKFGSSFASGSVVGDPMLLGFPPVLVTAPARLFVGAPNTTSLFPIAPFAGRFSGYIVQTGSIIPRFDIGEETMSKFAAP